MANSINQAQAMQERAEIRDKAYIPALQKQEANDRRRRHCPSKNGFLHAMIMLLGLNL